MLDIQREVVERMAAVNVLDQVLIHLADACGLARDVFVDERLDIHGGFRGRGRRLLGQRSLDAFVDERLDILVAVSGATCQQGERRNGGATSRTPTVPLTRMTVAVVSL